MKNEQQKNEQQVKIYYPGCFRDVSGIISGTKNRYISGCFRHKKTGMFPGLKKQRKTRDPDNKPK